MKMEMIEIKPTHIETSELPMAVMVAAATGDFAAKEVLKRELEFRKRCTEMGLR